MENEESAAGRERRRHARFACDGRAEVVVFKPDLLFRGEVKDISLTGCYIATRARLNLKRFAEIELRFSANGKNLSSLARVMEVRPGKGVGIEFLPGDPRMDQQFHELLETLSPDPISMNGISMDPISADRVSPVNGTVAVEPQPVAEAAPRSGAVPEPSS